MANARLKFDEDLIGDTIQALPPLSKEHEDFCQEVIATGNPAEAYRRCVAVSSETKPTTVWSQATRLMAKPSVRARIDELKARAAEYAHVTPGRIMAEYSKLAFFDVRKMLDGKGNPIPIHELDDNTAAGVAGVEFDVKSVKVNHDIYRDTDSEDDIGKTNEVVTTTRAMKVKLADKTKALDSLSKMLGLHVDKVEHTGAGGAPLIPENDNETARRVAFLLAQGLKES